MSDSDNFDEMRWSKLQLRELTVVRSRSPHRSDPLSSEGDLLGKASRQRQQRYKENEDHRKPRNGRD